MSQDEIHEITIPNDLIKKLIRKEGNNTIITIPNDTAIINDAAFPMLIEINNKIHTLTNQKEKTKEIINIAKETYKSEKMKHNLFYYILAFIISIFIGLILFDVHLYFHNKAEQVKIINNKLNENVLTETQINEISSKIEDCNLQIKELNKLVNKLNEKSEKTDENNSTQG